MTNGFRRIRNRNPSAVGRVAKRPPVGCCVCAKMRQWLRTVLRGAMWASRPTRCGADSPGTAKRFCKVVEDADPCEASLAEFAARKPRMQFNRFSGDMCGVVRPGALRSAAEASSTAPHPFPRPSSPNQSKRFDLVRSGSGMSLLSRSRGSKGYGACRDAAISASMPTNSQRTGSLTA